MLAEVRGRYEGGWVERICRYEIVNKQVYLIIIIKQCVLVWVSILVKRCHDNSSSYKKYV